MKKEQEYIVYVLICSDNTLYTGVTNNLEKRISVHNSGKGSKYVRTRLPVRVVHTENYPSKSTAMKREYEIKQWSRAEKISRLGLDI